MTLQFVAICLGTFLSGCASTGGLITSLEDLTTELSKEGLSKVPQYRVVSVPGILPFADVGSLQFYKPKRKPSSAIGLSNNNSYVMQTIIESECHEECLIIIRDNLLLLRAKAEAVVEARINLTRVSALVPLDGADSAKIDAYNQSVSAAKTAYSTARKDLDDKHQEVLKSINENGILIYRWSSIVSKKGSLGLGDMLEVSGSKNETYNGFALVSGLRIATMFVGNDLVSAWSNLNTDSNYSNRFEITTCVMQAQHIVYVTEYDLLGMIEAKLKASYAQLANLSETIKNLDRIEINAALSKVANLSNMGVLGKCKREKRDVDWSKPAGILDLSALNGWQTFYSVQSDLTDLMELLSDNKNNGK
jgi:hypothetical protein